MIDRNKLYTPESAANAIFADTEAMVSETTIKKLLTSKKLIGRKIGNQWFVTGERLWEYLCAYAHPSWLSAMVADGYIGARSLGEQEGE